MKTEEKNIKECVCYHC